ncbi:hypothetical protein [Actinomycetospora atypica]|uniref:Uncharacterized protein n=1 Tax=Actinomycetospora atypica TaxID=1290095 RepID=A0ABV9YKM1_9PSEU
MSTPPATAGSHAPAVVVLLLIAALVGAFWLADPSPAAPVAGPVVVTTSG